MRYDRLGNRPKRVLLPSAVVALSAADTAMLFFILYQAQRAAEQAG